MMQDHVVGLGSLAQTRARTPRVFRWGMRRNKHVLLSVRVSAHAKGHAPPKHSGVFALLALTAPRASVVGLNGLLGRVHIRRVVHPARPAWPVIEGPGQAGAEW